MCQTHLLLGELVVSLLDEIFDPLVPIVEGRAGHLEEGVTGGPAVLVPVLAQLLLSLLAGRREEVERLVGVGIDSHDEVGVYLDLLELVAEGEVTVAGEPLRQVGKALRKELALLIALALGGGRGGIRTPFAPRGDCVERRRQLRVGRSHRNGSSRGLRRKEAMNGIAVH